MPRMSGLELMREIRGRDLVPIIITAHATIDTAVEKTRQGAYSDIPKLITADELLLAIKNGLERRALSLEARRLREEREKRLLDVASERSKSNTIIACMTDGILVINVEKLVVQRNAAAARILPDCAGRTIPFPPEVISEPGVRENIGEATYMVNVSPVIEPGGEIPGAVAMFRDVTALKKLETAKAMFVSMVAHEVKSPLAATEGWLNLVLNGILKKDEAEERKMIQRSLLKVRMLRGMVSELLNITAIQTGNFTLHRAAVDVAAEVVEAYREKAGERGITISLCGALG